MDLEQKAIVRLREASDMSLKFYKLPLVITTSGGKDSSVCVHLAERAGIPFEVMHSHTTADAPETVYFIRQDLRRLEDKGIKCFVNMPVYKGVRTSMWNLIPQKLIPPTRLVRYCCSVLKERGGAGRFITTGVRWAESTKRKNTRGIYETMPSDPTKKIILNNDNDDRRRLFETCTIKAKMVRFAWSFRLSVDTLATENSTTRFRKLKTGVGRPLDFTPSHCLPMKKFSLVCTQSYRSMPWLNESPASYSLDTFCGVMIVLACFISFSLPQAEGITHSAARSLHPKSASLGFRMIFISHCRCTAAAHRFPEPLP